MQATFVFVPLIALFLYLIVVAVIIDLMQKEMQKRIALQMRNS